MGVHLLRQAVAGFVQNLLLQLALLELEFCRDDLSDFWKGSILRLEFLSPRSCMLSLEVFIPSGVHERLSVLFGVSSAVSLLVAALVRKMAPPLPIVYSLGVIFTACFCKGG